MTAKTTAPVFSACPYCGGTKFCEAKSSSSYGHVTRVGTIMHTVPLIHTVCLGCGGVIHTRVKSVEALLTRAEKEQQR